MKLKSNYLEFQDEIAKRNITELIHFTPTKNLYSIFEHGEIICRERLENLNIELFDILDYIKFTDEIRYDNKSYINLSLSCPNTFLLSKFKLRTKNDPTITWCILKIDPKHIYEEDTLYSITNAASYAAKNQFGISGDIYKFRQLFAPEIIIHTVNGNRVIKRENIRDKFPTDIQAEVLVKNSIPVDSIISVCFENEYDLAMTKAACSEFNTNKFIVDVEIFNPDRKK
jgi:hypothetical protein